MELEVLLQQQLGVRFLRAQYVYKLCVHVAIRFALMVESQPVLAALKNLLPQSINALCDLFFTTLDYVYFNVGHATACGLLGGLDDAQNSARVERDFSRVRYHNNHLLVVFRDPQDFLQPQRALEIRDLAIFRVKAHNDYRRVLDVAFYLRDVRHVIPELNGH